MTADKKYFFSNQISLAIYSLFMTLCIIGTADAVAVVSRKQRPSAAASRVPTMTAQIQATTNKQTPPPESDTTTEIVTETVIDIPTIDDESTSAEEIEPIENKATQFDDILNTISSTTDDSAAQSLASQIRAQRAALDGADSIAAAAEQSNRAMMGNANTCDKNLRACMMAKCGNDFAKCAGDTDTLWGTKMDACRRDLTCTGTEYRLFSAEIKADRDLNSQLAFYNNIIDCGNRYNDCIATECGQKFDKCLGKSAGDLAISKCDKIARSCTEIDNGLASRTMNVFGTLRQSAEKQVSRDEKRLYELRDLMRNTCNRLGAMFDERSLDCVYTVNFYAGDDSTLYASKKAYAGSSFNCDQNWFGVDITTFRENAYRLTREQTSASSALLGSGLGMGVGAITSGAIDRAVDRHRAERALKDAQAEHDEIYGDNNTDDDTTTDDTTDDTADDAADDVADDTADDTADDAADDTSDDGTESQSSSESKSE